MVKRITIAFSEKNMSTIDFNTIGLIFDIIVVLLLFKYVLTVNVSKEGTMNFVFEETDEEEKEKWKKYNFLSFLGLIFVILGFIFQIVSNFIS